MPTPNMVKIPVSRPSLSKIDIQAVTKALKNTFLSGGPAISEFEEKIAKYCGRKYAVTVTSGTSALLLALKALNLPKGAKVLVPSFTIVSALFAILECDYIPVFIDVDELTWNVDIATLKRSVREDLDMAIVVQTYASAPPMSRIYHELKKHNVPMIEDSAEGFGGSESGKKFGSFGIISVLSFYANKLISTGEGGMILTDDKDLYERLCRLRNLFFDKERKFIHKELSGNYRMANYQAALGISQFTSISAFYKHRKKLYNRYLELLGDLGEFIRFQYIPANTQSSYWVFPILLKKRAGFLATEFIRLLAKSGVEARHFFYPLDKQPFLAREYRIDSKISYNLWQYGLYLPLGNGITVQEVDYVAQIVRKLLKRGKIHE